jgi:hypothetical protein
MIKITNEEHRLSDGKLQQQKKDNLAYLMMIISAKSTVTIGVCVADIISATSTFKVNGADSQLKK